MILIASSTGSSSRFNDSSRYGAPAECLRLVATAVGILLLVGCSVVRLPSKRVDALIARYGARAAQAFDAGSWARAQAASGFAVQAAEFGVDWQRRVAGFVGRSSVPGPELQRLVLLTSDSTVMKHVVERVRSMFDQAPFEACASLADGTADRALIWRAESRGGVVIRMTAPSTSGATRRSWEGRLILVRHAVRRDDVGEIVSDLPCPDAAIDGLLSRYSGPSRM